MSIQFGKKYYAESGKTSTLPKGEGMVLGERNYGVLLQLKD